MWFEGIVELTLNFLIHFGGVFFHLIVGGNTHGLLVIDSDDRRVGIAEFSFHHFIEFVGIHVVVEFHHIVATTGEVDTEAQRTDVEHSAECENQYQYHD